MTSTASPEEWVEIKGLTSRVETGKRGGEEEADGDDGGAEEAGDANEGFGITASFVKGVRPATTLVGLNPGQICLPRPEEPLSQGIRGLLPPPVPLQGDDATHYSQSPPPFPAQMASCTPPPSPTSRPATRSSTRSPCARTRRTRSTSTVSNSRSSLVERCIIHSPFSARLRQDVGGRRLRLLLLPRAGRGVHQLREGERGRADFDSSVGKERGSQFRPRPWPSSPRPRPIADSSPSNYSYR